MLGNETIAAGKEYVQTGGVNILLVLKPRIGSTPEACSCMHRTPSREYVNNEGNDLPDYEDDAIMGHPSRLSTLALTISHDHSIFVRRSMTCLFDWDVLRR